MLRMCLVPVMRQELRVRLEKECPECGADNVIAPEPSFDMVPHCSQCGTMLWRDLTGWRGYLRAAELKATNG